MTSIVPLNEKPGSTILYSYWRSSCSWRVRIALHYKGIPFEYRPVNLLKAEQCDNHYAELNSSRAVPTLIIDNCVLTQSIAILEYLEERLPESWRLMPMEADKRAQVRAIVQMIASDIQPIQNLKVLQMVGAEKKMEWGKHWIEQGFEAVERMLQKTSSKYSVGDQVTLADVCLIPQVYNAKRFSVDMDKFPTISRIDKECNELEAFKKAHPDQQMDKTENK